MSAPQRLSDEEMERLAERLLDKLLQRLAKTAQQTELSKVGDQSPANDTPRHLLFQRDPPAEAYADVIARRRRSGRGE